MAVMTDRPSRPKNLDFFTGMAVGPEIKMQILEILGPEILEQIHILCPFLALNYNLLKTLPLNILLGTRNYSHLRASVRSGGYCNLNESMSVVGAMKRNGRQRFYRKFRSV